MTTSSPRVRRAQAKPTRDNSWILRWAASGPALLALLGIIVFGFIVAFQQSDRTQAHYREEADTALALNDYPTARLCYERLLQTKQDDPALWYGLARSLDGLNQVSQSVAILQRIAPVDAKGYAPAQLWLAEQLLETGHSEQANHLAEQHLQQVLRADPANAEAQSWLAALAAKQRDNHISR
jgi:predicted Zn-dependent protease